jgi:hypothetical protein
VRITPSISTGRSALSSASEGGALERCPEIMARGVSPVKGTCPLTISYSMMPNE